MAKAPITTTKYKIIARFKTSAPVEIPDVVGAIFGQTEGLFRDYFDLKELQRLGKIGRVTVKITKKDSKGTEGYIEVPSALTKEETAILAAMLETVDRIGPGEAKITVESIEDIREEKRRFILIRAKELLKKFMKEIPSGEEVAENLRGDIRKEVNVIEIGEDKLPAGKGIQESEEIIVVEGRADVQNLVKHGITNVIATNGIRVPNSLKEIVKNKVVTVFVDGDRGGKLLLEELLKNIKVDFVAIAPPGREVEDLSEKEIVMALRKKEPAFTYKKNYNPIEKKLLKYKKEVSGSKGCILFDKNLNILARTPIDNLEEVLNSLEEIYAVVTDELNDKIAKMFRKKGVEHIVVV